MDNELRDGSSIPSDRIKLLQIIKNEKLSKLIRFSWWESEESMEQCEIAQDEVFSLTAGPLLLYFESGLVIGAASDPSRNSVILWVEKDDTGYIKDESIENDTDLYPIDAEDKIYSSPYWGQIVGQNIKEINIIKRDPQNALFEELPNEVGLEIVMENDMKFILSHGLHDDSDDFSVLTTSQLEVDLIASLKWFAC
ncbi:MULTISPECIES: hypothetical protein [Paenibacillaceae]|uniref:Uncharacterized protein n=1 Tax=Paenibacillus azoreducens TaxID=116718 RepID=A0A919Y6R6_9BACL|nr:MULTISPECIES: hypothetical protein [Paenibacillaceae]RED20888.1 hypothetical protein DES34_1292 [Brevibacillus brevis]GEC93740.1 hypothetical protein BBR01nite_60710 [Brevibacillus brevis]GIO45981.1 hypothetical protein J34TS1_07460 [Paenibacillus azoreducens]VEF87804.1 Uncharacterised protein [Brevibacillus brevis]